MGSGDGARFYLSLQGGFLKRIATIFLSVLLICGQDVFRQIADSLLGQFKNLIFSTAVLSGQRFFL
jgi:hypothetical protein